MIAEALEQLGVRVHSQDGFLPLRLEGKLRSGKLRIDGSESSQLLTGLLMALPFVEGNSQIEVSNLKSIPYVLMTLDILAHFGISITHQNFELFQIQGSQTLQETYYAIEGDWSGAAFHLVGAAISGSLCARNLNPHSAQADRAILQALELAGTKIAVENEQIRVEKGSLRAFSFDATQCPDLFPPLAALAACCEGTSEIQGVSRLAHKESPRHTVLQTELSKMGIEVLLEDNTMRIVGNPHIRGAILDSHNDHRIAMTAAILALRADSPVTIENADAIDKSYPDFYEDWDYVVKKV
jgi:3-phosphoshikimate 1-carboxyvinyltransferase